MNLINISGNTFYIRGGTNTGLYLFDDNSALIIDPGLSGARPNKIIKILNERNIELKYIINTHEHNDHFGACIVCLGVWIKRKEQTYENIILQYSIYGLL